MGSGDGALFRWREGRACKPLILMTPGTCKAVIWFQVERSGAGRWTFSCWSLLESKGCEGVIVQIPIVALTQRSFAAQVKLLPALSKTKQRGYDDGECLILMD